jgi:hypothetical protein
MKSSTGSTTCRVETLYIRPLTSNESRPLIVSTSHEYFHSKTKGKDEKVDSLDVRFKEIPEFSRIKRSTHNNKF